LTRRAHAAQALALQAVVYSAKHPRASSGRVNKENRQDFRVSLSETVNLLLACFSKNYLIKGVTKAEITLSSQCIKLNAQIFDLACALRPGQ